MRPLKSYLAIASLMAATAAGPAMAQAPAAPAPAAPAAGASAAGTPAPAAPLPQPTEASLKEARAMAEMLSIPAQTRGLLQAMRNQLIQATIQASGKSVDEAAKIVDEVLMPDFNAALPELSANLIQPWAANFSAADLKGLHDFYSTPLGQRLLKTIPAVNQQSLQAGQLWGQKVFQETVKKHADELRTRGLKF
jgi:hypothetical protein